MVSPVEDIGGYLAAPYDYGEAREIADRLGLAEPIAIALVRRGHRSVDAARAFLEADERHSPSCFEGIGDAVGLIEAAIAAGRRITVHGDYDVDGICATAILVGALRRAGAEADWLIPDRLADGYGLGEATVGLLRDRGTGLLITADCGITSVAEIDAVRAAGIEAIVSDHHQPGDELPRCPIVHPSVSGYPFEHLCGTAVAHKLVAAFEHSTGSEPPPERDLDLVALATIADMVPLVGENRSLARDGLAELRRARRPGLRALMSAAGVEPELVDEGDVAFRLAPRINAAGRLYRADAGVELMLTADDVRAVEIATELDAANHERRRTEREVFQAAEAALRALPAELQEARALVLAGEGWHPGVVGIVASRIVERHGCPAIVLSVDAEGRARGSGRSVPGFDLLAGLQSCAADLDRFGGHRAAAGLEMRADRIDSFREAFAAHALTALPEAGSASPERIDAVVGADGLGIGTAEQLQGLAPFGQGNPGVRLLVPWARVGDLRPMGEDGKHARFNLLAGGRSARGVAFNSNGELAAAERSPRDLTVHLELNHWNGAVEPRAVLDAGQAPPESGPEGTSEAVCGCADPVTRRAWWERFEAELGVEPPGNLNAMPGPGTSGARRVITAHGGSAVARIAELVSSGARVLVIAADAARRATLVTEAAHPGRFGGTPAIVCGRCPDQAADAAAASPGPALVLTDWTTLARRPRLAADFAHVVAVDPPPLAAIARSASAGSGWLHEVWAAQGDDLAERCWRSEWDVRDSLAAIYRSLAGATSLEGEQLASALAGEGHYLRAGEVAARCVQVLVELKLAELTGTGAARLLRVVSSERTELERSGAWRAYTARFEEGLRYLESRRAEL